MNVPVDIVRKGKTEEYVKFREELARVEASLDQSEERYDEILKEIHDNVTYVPEFPFMATPINRQVSYLDVADDPKVLADKLHSLTVEMYRLSDFIYRDRERQVVLVFEIDRLNSGDSQ
jgi:hypothetical protein